ncbi:hypothetical protein [Paenibacillus tianjinensis]|uniref:Membrane protein NfeD2 N-terminal transmembrane domain-containing protein n=1 Tax=Paenibacillus tianjinensis TaxID=2810347 RepID=A0ABX7LIS1_9BACL|nr:hypothetical protein [Paenibacillus tianjinensis]QSF47351.1 hypothetical protein JRJ22_12715 [Paenibacillus tianjinensis]
MCFWVGLLLLLSGGFHGHGLAGHMHVGGGDAGGPGFVPILPLMVFVTVWGGTGYVFTRFSGMTMLAVVLISTVVALLLGCLMYVVLARVMTRYDSSMNEMDYEQAGQLGYISIPAMDGAVGEMKYVLHGTMRSLGVRAEAGQQLAKGDRVIILKVDKGMATVTLFEREFEQL